MTMLARAMKTAVLAELRAGLGNKGITDDGVRSPRGHDRSHLPWEVPMAVVHWTSTSTGAESEARAICSRHGSAAVTIAAGAGLEGVANSTADSICLDLSGMDKILRNGSADLDGTVQAGALKNARNAALAGRGVTFPVSPGVDASHGCQRTHCVPVRLHDGKPAGPDSSPGGRDHHQDGRAPAQVGNRI